MEIEIKEIQGNAAFSKLCEDIYDELKQYIYRKTNDFDLTKEIIQNTFLLATKKQDEVMNHPNPQGWLFNTAKNCCKKELAKYKITINNEEELLDKLEIKAFGESEDTAISDEIMSKLSKKERDLINYLYVEGYSLKEAAAELNVKYDALRKLNYRLTIKLRKLYDKYNY